MQWVVAKLVFSENAANNAKNEFWAILAVVIILLFLGVTFGHGWKLYETYFQNVDSFEVDKDWFLFRHNSLSGTDRRRRGLRRAPNKKNALVDTQTDENSTSLLQDDDITEEPSFTCQNCGVAVNVSYRFCPRCKHDLRAL